jgi:hypothetical protein
MFRNRGNFGVSAEIFHTLAIKVVFDIVGGLRGYRGYMLCFTKWTNIQGGATFPWELC